MTKNPLIVRLGVAGALALVSPFIAASTAGATVAPAGTTGSVQVVASPPSLAPGAFTSDTAIRVVPEQALTLSANVTILGVGTNGWTGTKSMTAALCVQSHLVHMERATTGAGTLTGTVTFTTDVVGVATDVTGLLTGALSATDPVFANPGTTYAAGATGRGLEVTIPLSDRVTLPSARTVGLTLRAGPDMDEMRIITLCDGPTPVVPEAPFAVLLPLSAAAAGFALLTARRRRPV